MATRAKPGGSNAATSGSKPEAGIHAALEGLLADLGGVADLQLVIERTFPLPAGHLETIPVPDDFAPQQLLETMRARYGPGSYRVRPYGRSGDTGKMVSLHGGKYSTVPIEMIMAGKKRVDVAAFYDIQNYRPKIRDFMGVPMFMS